MFFDDVCIDVDLVVGVLGDGWWVVMVMLIFECGVLMLG